MKTSQSLVARATVPASRGKPLLALTSPLLGLVYILVVPFIGMAAIILAGTHRVRQMFTKRRVRKVLLKM